MVEANLRALRERDPASPALDRYAEAARLLTGDPDASTVDGLDWLRETAALMRVPAIALPPGTEDLVVERTARASSTQGNPVVLTGDELHTVLAQALT